MGTNPDLKPRGTPRPRTCLMCGAGYEARRPESLTDTSRCRSRLHTFRKIYQCDPIAPLGSEHVLPARSWRSHWNAKFLPSNHPLNRIARKTEKAELKPPVPDKPKPKPQPKPKPKAKGTKHGKPKRTKRATKKPAAG